jgi:hypothetical protein
MLAWSFPFLSGLWTTLVTPSTNEPLIDANGTALSLNQVVKIVGKIVSLSATDPHFGGVGVMASHPSGNGPLVGEIFFVDPSQVVVGS